MPVCGTGPPPLRDLLETWLELISERPPKKEAASWRYQERAIVSTVAGAVWASRGFALEDFRYHKYVSANGAEEDQSASFGRCDLWFRLPTDLSPFVLEAKHAYKSLNQSYSTSESVFKTQTRDAVEDTRKLFNYDHSTHTVNMPTRVALAAVTAVLNTDAVDCDDEGDLDFDYEAAKAWWIGGLQSISGLKAWHFVEDYVTRYLASKNPNWFCPGVGLILRTID